MYAYSLNLFIIVIIFFLFFLFFFVHTLTFPEAYPFVISLQNLRHCFCCRISATILIIWYVCILQTHIYYWYTRFEGSHSRVIIITFAAICLFLLNESHLNKHSDCQQQHKRDPVAISDDILLVLCRCWYLY